MIKLTALCTVLLVCLSLKGLSWLMQGILECCKDIFAHYIREEEKQLGYTDFFARLGITVFTVIGILEISNFYKDYLA